MFVIPVLLLLVFGSVDYHRQAELEDTKQELQEYKEIKKLKEQIKADLEKEASEQN